MAKIIVLGAMKGGVGYAWDSHSGNRTEKRVWV